MTYLLYSLTASIHVLLLSHRNFFFLLFKLSQILSTWNHHNGTIFRRQSCSSLCKDEPNLSRDTSRHRHLQVKKKISQIIQCSLKKMICPCKNWIQPSGTITVHPFHNQLLTTKAWVGSVVAKVALGQVTLWELQFSLSLIIPLVLHIH